MNKLYLKRVLASVIIFAMILQSPLIAHIKDTPFLSKVFASEETATGGVTVGNTDGDDIVGDEIVDDDIVEDEIVEDDPTGDDTATAGTTTVDIEGAVVFLGTGTIEPEQLELTLYVDGTADRAAVAEVKTTDGDEFEELQYRFSGLPKADEEGREYAYAVKSEKNVKNGVNLYYIADGKVVGKGSETPRLPADLVFAGETFISGAYRVEKSETAPAPEDVHLAAGVVDDDDAEFLTAKETVLNGGDTSWRISGLLGYNPITKSKIEYYAQVTQNAEDYEEAYVNMSLYKGETQYARQGGTVVNSYTGIEIKALAGLFSINGVTEPGSYTASINWNDNLNNSDEGKRPDDVDITLIPWYKDTDDVYKPLTKYILMNNLGVSEEEANTLFDNLSRTIENNKDTDNKTYKEEEFTGLLSKVTVTSDEGETVYDIGYTFKIDSTDSDTFDNDYVVEPKNGHKGNVIGDDEYSPDFVIMCTAQAEYTIKKVWKDGSDEYNTRPNSTELLNKLELHTFVTGDELNAEKTNLNAMGSNVTVDDTETDEWTITITGMRAFTAEGKPIYHKVIEDAIGLAQGSDFDGDTTVHYATTYENTGNYTDDADACYDGGRIVNKLEDTVKYTAKKQWQDDGTPDTINDRPKGTLILMCYPDDGRDYKQATPVVGMVMDLKTDPKEDGTSVSSYTIDFSGVEGYPAGDPDATPPVPAGFPRFDINGYEYVYFVQEIFSGDSNGYVRFIDESPNPATKNVLENGQTLKNRKTGTTTVSATKEWIAASMQSMTASIKLLLERQKKLEGGSWSNTWEPVDTGDLDEFRAEEMTKSYDFENLPKYDDRGFEYKYQITEQQVSIVVKDGNGSVTLEWEEGETSQRQIIGGYAYDLERETNVTTGNVKLTNKLVGKTDVRIKKEWTDGNTGNKDATFNISSKNGTVGSYTYKSYATGDKWSDDNDSGYETREEDGGDWIVVSGFDRYDDKGHEIEYTVREEPVAGYTTTYDTTYGQKKDGTGEWVGQVETTVINTPVGEGGRYITVRKEWLDDGDEACRGEVEVALFHVDHVDGKWTSVGTYTLKKGNDWTAYPNLADKGCKDYNHYYMREMSVKGAAVAYADDYDDEENEPLLTTVSTPPIGTVMTNQHNYNCFITVNEKSGAKIKEDHDGNAAFNDLDNGTNYRTSYTFQNVRTGIVNVDLKKDWQDGGYHEDLIDSITLTIRQHLNYGSTAEFGTVDLEETGGTTTGTISGYTIIYNKNYDPDTEENTDVDWGARITGLPKYNDQGVLYSYSVAETAVTKAESVTDFEALSGGVFKLNGHRYVASVSSHIDYGEHTGSPPIADEAEYTATNARSEMITDFKVYKIWHDVVRTNPIGEGAALIEVKKRPAIFLTLWRTTKTDASGNPVDFENMDAAPNPYIERVWTTSGTGGQNEYYWMCSFADLPRYAGNGEEYIYSVRENNITDSEYVTEYYDLDGGEVPEAVDGAKGAELEEIAGMPIYTEPDSAKQATEGVQNGGIIVNRREDTRKLTGRKIWQNIPKEVSFSDYPTIKLELRMQDGFDAEGKEKYDKVDGVDYETIEDGSPIFEFDELDKYDEYGAYIKYRAAEISTLTNGYQTPKYNDYMLEIYNVYGSNDKVEVTVTKAWEFEDDDLKPASEDLYPTATIELYQVMLDDNGDPTDTPPRMVNSDTIKYGDAVQTVTFKRYSAEAIPFAAQKEEDWLLPKYGYNGNPFNYYVEESLNGYAVTDSGDNFEYTVTNTYNGKTVDGTGEYVKLYGTKKWDDQDNKYGKRPADADGLILKISRSVKDVSGDPVDITNEVTTEWDGWYYTVKANDITVGDSEAAGDATLYRYAPNGKEYIYHVKEEVDDEEFDTSYHYTLPPQEQAKGAPDVKADLTNTLKTVPCSVNKQWNKIGAGGDEVAIKRAEYALALPDNVAFKVEYYDGDSWERFDYKGTDPLTFTKEQCIEDLLDDDGLMTVTVTGLPKYGDLPLGAVAANEVKYRIVEDGEPAGFTVKPYETDSDGITTTITNLRSGTIPLTIKKVWIDNENQDGVRPTSITFKVVRDGIEAKAELVTLNATELSTGKTIYVPKYKDGSTDELSTYTVEEMLNATEKGYYKLISTTGNEKQQEIDTCYILVDPDPDGDGLKEYEFTNQRTPATMKVTATKTWADVSNEYDTRPAELTLRLMKSPNASGSGAIPYDENTDHKFTDTSPATLTYTWENLPVRENGGATIYYSVIELHTPLKGYVNPPTYSASVSGGVGDTQDTPAKDVTIINTLKTTTFTVNKTWANGGSVFTVPKLPVTMQLWYRLANLTQGDDDNWAKFGSEITITYPTLTHTFTGLPVEDHAGTDYEYKVEEIAIDGTTVTDGFASGYTGTNPNKTTTPSTVTNTLETIELTIKKFWDDNSNQDGVQPSSVTFKIARDGGVGADNLYEVTLNAAEFESGKTIKVPKYKNGSSTELSVYTVEEVSSDPDKLAYYKVNDQAAAGYIMSAPTTTNTTTGAMEYAFTNVHTMATMALKVTKVWANDYDDGVRPESVTLQLKQSVSPYGTANTTNVGDPETIGASESWTKTWTNLPVMSGGNKIHYSVVEVPTRLPGYKNPVYAYTVKEGTGGSLEDSDQAIAGSIDDPADTEHEATVTNEIETVKVVVKKVWDDHENLYSSRPANLTFTLQRRLTLPYTSFTDVITENLVVDQNIETAVNEQEVKFENLPKYDTTGGVEVEWEYRAIETAADPANTFEQDLDPISGKIKIGGHEYNFTSSTAKVTGGYETTVRNTLKEEKISIFGTKEWDDDSNRFGSRPNSLPLKLYYFDDFSPTASNNWEPVDDSKYTIDCDDIGGDTWVYEITGDGLLKYKPGTEILIEYCVQEVVTDSSLSVPGYQVTVTNPPDPLTSPPADSSVGTGRDGSDNIEGVYFKNSLEWHTALSVTKETNIVADNTSVFTFNVYFSPEEIDDDNEGTLYKGPYDVYGDYDSDTGTWTPKKDDEPATDGDIKITAGQKFVLDHLPMGYYYSVVEAEHDDYVQSDAPKNTSLNGPLNNTTDTLEVMVSNKLREPKLNIINVTPNPTDNSRGDLKIGGRVVVGYDDPKDHDIFDTTDFEDKGTKVAWIPEQYWILGNLLRIEYWPFYLSKDEDPLYIEIDNFSMQRDDDEKSLEEIFKGNAAALLVIEEYFKGAKVTINDEDIVVLKFEDYTTMPRETTVKVDFVPTIAIRNITKKDSGELGGIGGTVRVEGEYSGYYDGLSGRQYTGYKVFGLADEGYYLDMEHILLRNFNDLDGTIYKADEYPLELTENPDGTYSFDQEITTISNDVTNAKIRIKGKLIEETSPMRAFTMFAADTKKITNFRIELEPTTSSVPALPVPLQIDVRFLKIPESSSSDPSDSSDPSEPSGSSSEPSGSSSEPSGSSSEPSGSSSESSGPSSESSGPSGPSGTSRPSGGTGNNRNDGRSHDHNHDWPTWPDPVVSSVPESSVEPVAGDELDNDESDGDSQFSGTSADLPDTGDNTHTHIAVILGFIAVLTALLMRPKKQAKKN